MLYGGMLGLSICRGIQNVSMERVQQAYRDLSQLNRMLRQCIQDITKAENVVQYHAQANQLFVQLRPTWRDNILMPTEETAPMAAQIPIYDLPIISNENQIIKDVNGTIIPEERGGIAPARKDGTFAAYIKQQLLNANRRFARDSAFLFWAFDIKQKSNIHSANRHTIRTRGRDLTKYDLLDTEGKYDYTKVTIVPHNISLSYAYHRKHYLDLKAMCDNLGPPQLFLTFSCDDKATSFQNATGLRDTCQDPVLFALHL